MKQLRVKARRSRTTHFQLYPLGFYKQGNRPKLVDTGHKVWYNMGIRALE